VANYGVETSRNQRMVFQDGQFVSERFSEGAIAAETYEAANYGGHPTINERVVSICKEIRRTSADEVPLKISKASICFEK
jgi:hypothetical protein